MAEKKDREGPIGIRLDPDVKLALEQAAEANNRSLHGEIVYRLKIGVLPENELDTAWGLLIALLTGQLELTVPTRSEPERLALIREAFAASIDEMGAKDAVLSDDQKTIAQAIGRSNSSNSTDSNATPLSKIRNMGTAALRVHVAGMKATLAKLNQQQERMAASTKNRIAKGRKGKRAKGD